MEFTCKNHSIIVCFLLIFILIEFGCRVEPARSIQEALMSERFEGWMVENGRVYQNGEEKKKRYSIFNQNVNYIDSFNAAGNQSYKLRVNPFTDLTNEEFKATRNGLNTNFFPTAVKRDLFKYANLTDVPLYVDWRDEGAVTPVKNQRQCGSCWAFSAVASMEGIIKIKTGKLISLSEQELVDCVTENRGCNGGAMEYTYEFIQRNNGIATEADYPYNGRDGVCRVTKSAATISGFENVPFNSEKDLQNAVANQPVSVIIDASGYDFQFYHSGIFGGSCGRKLNHAVTVVGYGVSNDNGRKYWLVKNSWGIEWGEQGYIRIERDVVDAQGTCGIAIRPSYPIA